MRGLYKTSLLHRDTELWGSRSHELAPIRSLLECGGKGVKGARHRFVIRGPISLDRKRCRRSPPLPPNSAPALHKTEPLATHLFGS